MGKKTKYISTVDATKLSQVGFDTHAHISKQYFEADIPIILERAKNAGLSHIMNICLTQEAYQDTTTLYDTPYIEIYSAVALHPCDAGLYTPVYIDDLYRIIQKDSRCKAIGETGLDFYWKDVPKEIQYTSFHAHIELAKKCNLPLILHSREAEKETIAYLEEHTLQGYPIIFHCYSGTASLAKYIIEQGWYISFSGNISYPSASSIREAIHEVPLERMLIETDCPYLAPQPQRGKRNEPSFVAYTAEAISYELHVPVQEIWEQTAHNARAIFLAQ